MSSRDGYLSGWVTLMVLLACGLVLGLTKCNELHVKDACFRAGYASFRASIINDNYCVKRVNQTDVVVPLKIVEKQGAK